MAKDTRVRLLDTTARLLQLRGYHGASLNDILTESGAPRGSLYFHFPGGKEQLAFEATRQAIEEVSAELHQAFDNAANTAEALEVMCDAMAAYMEETQFTFGCPVAPVILDAAGGITALEELCQQAFDEWLQIFSDSLQRSGVAKDRVYPLALFLESAFEGMLLVARGLKDANSIRVIGRELVCAVRAAMPPD